MAARATMRDVLTLLVVLAVAAVLFVAAVIATQDTEVLVEAPPDQADVDLPPGHVVAEDLRSVRFGMVFRGYRMSQVDEVLDRLGGELVERDERIADLERVLAEIVEPVVAEAESQQAPPVEPEESTPPPAEQAVDLAASFWLASPAGSIEVPVAPPVPTATGTGTDPELEDEAPSASHWEPAPAVAEAPVPAVSELLEPYGSETLTEPEPGPEPEPTPLDAAEGDGFPEVAPAEPAVPGLPEAVEDTGEGAPVEAGDEAWRRPPPSQEP